MTVFLIVRVLTMIILCEHLNADFQSPWLSPKIRPSLYEICLTFPSDESSFDDFVDSCLSGFTASKNRSLLSRLRQQYGKKQETVLSDSYESTSPYVDDFAGANKTGNLTFFGTVSEATLELRFYASERIIIIDHLNSFSTNKGNIAKAGEKYTLTFDERLPENSAFYIEFVFKSHLTRQNCKQCPFDDRSWAKDSDGNIYFSTNLGGRLFSPSFDEPSFKSRYQLSVSTPSYMKVLSNGRTVNVSNVGKNKKGLCHHFQKSPIAPPWGTILVAGSLSTICKFNSGIEWCVSGLPANIPGSDDGLKKEADRIIHFAAQSYDLMKSWLKVEPEMFGKIDIVGLPNFMTAISLPGFIIFRDEYLWMEDNFEKVQKLITDTRNQSDNWAVHKEQFFAIVGASTYHLGTLVHEISHQWFANLVTHHWWNDLWLTETIATVIEYDVLIKLDQFPFDRTGLFQKQWLKYRSITENLIAAQREMTVSDDLGELFNIGVYFKGASILEMLKSIIGRDEFYEGLHIYLLEHSFKSATAQNLFDAFQKSVDKNKVYQYEDKEYKLLNVTDFLSTWIYTSHVPKVHASLSQSGRAINFHQSAYLSSDESTLWNIPIMFNVQTTSASNIFTFWLRERNATWNNPLNEPFDYVFFHDSPELVYPIFYDELLDPINRGFFDNKSNCAQISMKSLLVYLVNRELPRNLTSQTYEQRNNAFALMHLYYRTDVFKQSSGLNFCCDDLVKLYQDHTCSQNCGI